MSTDTPATRGTASVQELITKEQPTPYAAVVEGMPLTTRIVNLIAVMAPVAGLIAAMVYAWERGFDWVQLVLLVVMYLLTGFGITIGFHRLFTHRSFETSRVMQTILVALGSMALEGSLLHWVACHRKHHQHSDHDEDPHSPHTHGHGFISMLRGFWRAHVGWIFEGAPREIDRYAGDLIRDPFVKRLSALFPLWIALSLIIPTVLGGLLTWSWMGALLGFIWGGLVRILIVHHVTWSINSVCHIWGTRSFRSSDESRNNVIFGVLGLGEGWHNNHHAFPSSARHGLRWWEFDISFIVIVIMSRLGLVWNVRTPRSDQMLAKKIS